MTLSQVNCTYRQNIIILELKAQEKDKAYHLAFICCNKKVTVVTDLRVLLNNPEFWDSDCCLSLPDDKTHVGFGPCVLPSDGDEYMNV